MANPIWRQTLLRTLILVSAGFWIYSPALTGIWLWDDDVEIMQNPALQTAQGLWTIWFQPGHQLAYDPVTLSVEWIEWHLWGPNPSGFHLVTFFFHMLNGFLVWRLFARLGLTLAWLGGLLFVIHPMNVESVAWMVELKNTLSLTPLLLAMCAYIDYEDHQRPRDYFLSLGLFLVAMLGKTSVLMFPAVILLYIWWKRRRIVWTDLKACLPFFAILLLLGLLSAGMHHQREDQATAVAGWPARFATVGWEMLFLSWKFLFPLTLLPIYPSLLVVSPSLLDLLPWLLLGSVLAILWLNRQGWGHHAALGLGFYLLNLFPVFAFGLMNGTTLVWTLDHVIYLPMIGLIGLVIAALGEIQTSLSVFQRQFAIGAVTLVVLLLVVRAHLYAAIFRDPETMWTYTLRYNDEAWPAHDNLGNQYFMAGRIDEAVAQYQRSLAINPNRFEAHNNLGLALALRGRYAEAIDQYAASLKINPAFAAAHANMADALVKLDRIPEAKDQYEQALKIDPGNGAFRQRLDALQSR
jgi:tetratricopeptide (TPR) repeat protein